MLSDEDINFDGRTYKTTPLDEENIKKPPPL